MASRGKLGVCGGDNEVPQSAEVVSKGRGKSSLQRDCMVWEDFGSVRVCFLEIFCNQNGVGDIRPSGWVVNGRKGIVVAPIRFLGCRRDAEFLAEWLNVWVLDPLSLIRNPFEI